MSNSPGKYSIPLDSCTPDYPAGLVSPAPSVSIAGHWPFILQIILLVWYPLLTVSITINCSYGKCCNPSTSYTLIYAAELVSYSPSVSLTRVVMFCKDTQDDDSLPRWTESLLTSMKIDRYKLEMKFNLGRVLCINASHAPNCVCFI